ncbi:hypothetical protein IWX76_002715 [Pedobacter sp. CAN_A7]|uniref:hypothetical protein n=1 Tax=Pedobacter sp. CAN_A7 TaxID=2787722 RepID=UPI0018CBAA7B
MKSLVYLTLFFALNTNFAKSQAIPSVPQPRDYRTAIVKILGKHINTDSLFATPSEHVYIFSMSLSFNAAGKVDRGVFQ